MCHRWGSRDNIEIVGMNEHDNLSNSEEMMTKSQTKLENSC